MSTWYIVLKLFIIIIAAIICYYFINKGAMYYYISRIFIMLEISNLYIFILFFDILF